VSRRFEIKQSRILATVCAISAFLAGSVARADGGSWMLAVRCDTKAGIFEVRPVVMVNEEFDALAPQMTIGRWRIRQADRDLLYFGEYKERGGLYRRNDIESVCTIGRTRLKVYVSNSSDMTMYLFAGKEAVTTFHFEWSYDTFRIRYSRKDGWLEQCGRNVDSLPWRPLDRNRKEAECH
jgi:hypothetical protein